MTLAKRPASSGLAQSADDFISRAPDAAHVPTAALSGVSPYRRGVSALRFPLARISSGRPIVSMPITASESAATPNDSAPSVNLRE
ncbi:hypothetical protein LMG28688_05877 [Paraburkholderia caffeinitolerans]|uniref:Uncharacterized protein n=1 Tax=Paraburkholderia caffeinitolerans TaxID=1723730 RepID=A0A6J5GN71_9BURK|nr:hypothetical protein LMG28688_05877 [Paraburkholderia caffeinitolerans]